VKFKLFLGQSEIYAIRVRVRARFYVEIQMALGFTTDIGGVIRVLIRV
jgi:hypothetical protein